VLTSGAAVGAIAIFPRSPAPAAPFQTLQAAAVTSRPSRGVLISKTWVIVLVAVLRRRAAVALGHDTSLPLLLAATTHDVAVRQGGRPVRGPCLSAHGRLNAIMPAGQAGTGGNRPYVAVGESTASMRLGTCPTWTRNLFRSAGYTVTVSRIRWPFSSKPSR
jgi:hypothetical protein